MKTITRTDSASIGEEFGFYAALAGEPVTAAELAGRTGTEVSFVSRWLEEQTRQDYLTFDATSGRYAAYCRWPRGN
jgi:hypothetical protein